jgi:sulfur carrier protein ThiS
LKVRIKLYGTLSKSCTGYDPTTGIEMEIPGDTRVGDLLEKLNISRASIGLVSMDETLVKADDRVLDGSEVKFFQPICGG